MRPPSTPRGSLCTALGSLCTAAWRGVVAVALTATVATAVTSARATEDPSWTRVTRGDLRLELVESGDIEAVRSHRVVAPFVQQSSLQIVFLAPEGVAVEAGDTLVVFDEGALETRAAETRTALEREQVELRGVEAEQAARRLGLQNAFRSAEFTMEQADLQLEKLEYESQTRRQEARLSWNKAQVSLEAARTKLKAQAVLDSLEIARTQRAIASHESQREQIERYLRDLTLVAPIGGLVVYAHTGRRSERRKIRLGDEIQPGAPVVEIPDLELMDVVFEVHEVDREKVSVGMPAHVSLQAYPDQAFAASILELAPLALAPESESSVRLFSVRARIDSSAPVLKPGMSAQVILTLATTEAALLLPLDAIFERDGAAVVFPRSVWPQTRRVRLGLQNHRAAVVLEGLEQGEEVAMAPPADAHDVCPLGSAEFHAGPGRWEATPATSDSEGSTR